MIADYHDYDKYCKPAHFEKLKEIINNIGDIFAIMDIDQHTISPNIAYCCWGAGAKYLADYDNENMVGLYDYEGGGWNDDEENNFGMDYDDTHYYGDEDDYEGWYN